MEDIRNYEYGTPRSKKEVLKGLESYKEKSPCYVVFRPVGVTGSLRYARYTTDHSDDIIGACELLGFGSFENFKCWSYGGLFDFCLGSAVDTLYDMLEITSEKRHKYTEQEAKTVLVYKIFNRMVKNIGDAYFIKGNEFNIRFNKEKMIKRLEQEGRLDQVTPEIEEIMNALDGQPVTAQCWRRVVYDEPVYWCISKDGKIAEYVNEADCE